MKHSSNQGQTLIEFAIIIIPLFVLILGIMEFGIIIYDKSVLTDACREGARAGVLYRTDSATSAYDPLSEAEIKAVIGNYVQNRLLTFGTPFDPSTDVVVAWNPDPPTPGGILDVRINFTYSFLALSILGNMETGTLNLSSRSAVRME